MKELVTRTVTGVLYVILLVGCTVYSPLTSVLFFALVASAGVWEFCNLANTYADADINVNINTLAAVVLVGAVWQWQLGIASGALLALYGFTLLYILITELYRKAENPFRNWAFAFASQIYVALPFALLPLISIFYDPMANRMEYVWIYPLSLFIFLWTSDTGAYVVGSLLGKKIPYKLFPRISPNKSWVGSIGGGLLCLGVAVLLWYVFPGTLLLWQWLGFGAVVCVFGTWGDLIESMMKRQFGIKDSGKILPGHGGILDRFDSALLAIPASVVYFYAVGGM